MIGNTIQIKKSSNLLYIEEQFGKIKARVDIESALESIKKTLIKEYGCNIKSILITEKGDEFYGMRTFYSKSTSVSIVKMIKRVADEYPSDQKDVDDDKVLKKYRTEVTKTTQVGVELIIEIDPLLLWSKTLNLTPAELTAVLLHEIGHFGIHAYDFMIKVRSAFLISLSAMGFRAISILKVMPFNVWAGIGALILTEMMIGTRCTGIKFAEETLADRFVIERGYGLELESVLKKLIDARYMERYDLPQFKKLEDKELINKCGVAFNMSLQTIGQLDGRRDEIRKILSLCVEKSKGSPTFKMQMEEFISDIFEKMHPSNLMNMARKEKAISESLQIQADKLTEGIIEKLFGRKKAIGERELDALRIEVEMINDYYDKIDVIDKIHRNIGATNKYVEYITNEIENNAYINKYEKEKLSKDLVKANSILRDLEELKKKAMEVKIVEKQYGVFVKVPKGYEG